MTTNREAAAETTAVTLPGTTTLTITDTAEPFGTPSLEATAADREYAWAELGRGLHTLITAGDSTVKEIRIRQAPLLDQASVDAVHIDVHYADGERRRYVAQFDDQEGEPLQPPDAPGHSEWPSVAAWALATIAANLGMPRVDRTVLIAAAATADADLFNPNGYNGSSVVDLADLTGMPKPPVEQSLRRLTELGLLAQRPPLRPGDFLEPLVWRIPEVAFAGLTR